MKRVKGSRSEIAEKEKFRLVSKEEEKETITDKKKSK
jgi:hypothetical protein